MKIILSHCYDIRDKYFVIETKEEPLEKFFLKLATLLIVSYNLDSSFELERDILTKILKEKFHYASDLKPHSYNELWNTNQVIECHTFSFSTLFKNQTETNIYHLDLYSFWEGYFSSSLNKRNLERIDKELKNNKEFYKKIYQEISLIMKNQYKEFYDYKIIELEKKMQTKEIKEWF